MNGKIEAIGSIEEHYRGRLIRITKQLMRLPNGKEIKFETAERPPGVRILVSNDKNILMTKEWRSELNDWDYRLPGGKVFDSFDEYVEFRDDKPKTLEASLLASMKELKEETGLAIDKSNFKFIHHSICGATIKWDLYYYRAIAPELLPQLSEIKTEEGEHTVPVWLSFNDVEELCIKGKISEDRTQAVLFRFLHR